MNATLRDAIRVLDERKHALYGEDNANANCTVDQMRCLLVGLDLDGRELSEHAEEVMTLFISAVAAGVTDVDAAFRGCWPDGVMTGLLLAHLREREEARS